MKRIILGCLAVHLLGTGLLFAQERRHIVKVGTNVTIASGESVRDAVVVGGNLVVSGRVEHDAVAVGGSITIMPNAFVGHNAVSVGGTVVQDRAATVNGEVVEVAAPGISSLLKSGFVRAWAAAKILSFIGLLALALLIAVLLPKQIEVISHIIEQDTLSVILWSILGMILIFPLTVLLAVSVIGLLFIPLEIALIVFMFLIGYVAVARFVGTKISAAFNRPRIPLVWNTLIGIVILGLVGLIPFIGWLIVSLALLLGYGGVITAVVRSREKKTV